MKMQGYLAATVVAAGMMSMSSFAVRMIDADYILAADEDWTNDGTVVLRNSPRIDLDGHTLTIAGASAFSITNKTGIVEGYSDLEFLDVSGDQRVETDFKPLDSDIVEMGVMFLSCAYGGLVYCVGRKICSDATDRRRLVCPA